MKRRRPGQICAFFIFVLIFYNFGWKKEKSHFPKGCTLIPCAFRCFWIIIRGKIFFGILGPFGINTVCVMVECTSRPGEEDLSVRAAGRRLRPCNPDEVYLSKIERGG